MFKELLDTGLDVLKTDPQKVVHKAPEAIGEFIGYKLAEKILKPKYVIDKNPRNIEERIIRPGTREKILNKWRQVL